MKQLDQSVIIGIFGLIGLFIGLFVKNIMVWTFVGIAVGYVITFWIPYFKKKSQLKKKNTKTRSAPVRDAAHSPNRGFQLSGLSK